MTIMEVSRFAIISHMDLEDLLMPPRGEMFIGKDKLVHKDTPAWEPEKPLGSAILWKYMSFSKFMSLLRHKALFFSLVGKMDDEYEGFIRAPKQSDFEDQSSYEVERTWHEILSEMKQKTIVCCWAESEHESNVMWKSYTGMEREGIAIKTTCHDLLESVVHQAKSKLTLGKVKYMDYKQNRVPVEGLAPLFHKRVEFKSEEEVRLAAALQFNLGESEIEIPFEVEKSGGLYIPVDLNRLVKEVVVAPKSDPWFIELVSKQIEQSSLKACVVPSTI